MTEEKTMQENYVFLIGAIPSWDRHYKGDRVMNFVLDYSLMGKTKRSDTNCIDCHVSPVAISFGIQRHRLVVDTIAAHDIEGLRNFVTPWP